MTFDGLWTWIAIALPAFVALLVPLPAVDLAYQVRAGNEIMATGALPGVDTWTFTVYGTPWVDQQWLAQVKLAAGYAIGGWELLAVVRAVLVGLFTGLMVATARSRGASPRMAAILALVAFAIAAPALALRPQLYGIVFFAFLLWLIAARDRWPRPLWLAPFVILVWANIHGSFVLGPAILGYVWLSDVAAGRPARESFAILVAGTAGDAGQPVPRRRLDLRAQHRRQSGHRRPGQRVAAHLAARDAGDPVLSVGRRHPPAGLARAAGSPLAGLGAAGGDGQHGRLGGPGRRLVGAGAGVRARGSPGV